jgi:hypothetical protein
MSIQLCFNASRELRVESEEVIKESDRLLALNSLLWASTLAYHYSLMTTLDTRQRGESGTFQRV